MKQELGTHRQQQPLQQNEDENIDFRSLPLRAEELDSVGITAEVFGHCRGDLVVLELGRQFEDEARIVRHCFITEYDLHPVQQVAKNATGM